MTAIERPRQQTLGHVCGDMAGKPGNKIELKAVFQVYRFFSDSFIREFLFQAGSAGPYVLQPFVRRQVI